MGFSSLLSYVCLQVLHILSFHSLLNDDLAGNGTVWAETNENISPRRLLFWLCFDFSVSAALLSDFYKVTLGLMSESWPLAAFFGFQTCVRAALKPHLDLCTLLFCLFFTESRSFIYKCGQLNMIPLDMALFLSTRKRKIFHWKLQFLLLKNVFV